MTMVSHSSLACACVKPGPVHTIILCTHHRHQCHKTFCCTIVHASIRYDYNANMARRFDHPSLHPDPDMKIDINGREFNFPLPSDGIALSDDAETVFYCEISRQILWSVPARRGLANFSLTSAEIGQGVVNHGVKGYSDGMTHDDKGRLYFGNQATSEVMQWDTSSESIDDAVVVARQNATMQWPDTFAWDGQGNLIFVSNKLQLFAFGGMAFDGSDGANFRLWSVDVGGNSYLSKDPKPKMVACEMP